MDIQMVQPHRLAETVDGRALVPEGSSGNEPRRAAEVTCELDELGGNRFVEVMKHAYGAVDRLALHRPAEIGSYRSAILAGAEAHALGDREPLEEFRRIRNRVGGKAGMQVL
jgi:hypothetical protein